VQLLLQSSWQAYNPHANPLWRKVQLLLQAAKQSQKNPVSASAMLTGIFFVNPESFCNKLIICWRISGYFGKCPDTIQNIQIICKVSG
jgi:hypothetical protein